MKKATVFIDIERQYGTNPLAGVFNSVATAFGAEIMEKLVSGDVEADIAITNSITTALRMVKETEHTSIMLATFQHNNDKESNKAFANRFPTRVSVGILFAADGEMELIVCLCNLINSKSEEEV